MNPRSTDWPRRFAASEQRGATVVLVEHNFRLIFDVSDQIFVLNLGKLIASGTAQHILADEDVAHSYLGRLAESGSTEVAA